MIVIKVGNHELDELSLVFLPALCQIPAHRLPYIGYLLFEFILIILMAIYLDDVVV